MRRTCLAILLLAVQADQLVADPEGPRARQWVRLSRLIGHRVNGNAVELTCAGDEPAAKRTIRLGFCDSRVVRLCGDAQGDFAATGIIREQPAIIQEPGGILRIGPARATDRAVTVVVAPQPFSVLVRRASGRDLVCISDVEVDLRAGAESAPEGWRIRLPAADGEAFYGFGERFDAVNQRGHHVPIWGMDAGVGSFLRLRRIAYKNSPFFLSSRRYAIFWDSSYRLDCDMAASSQDRVTLTADGPILDLHIFCHEDPRDSLTAMSELTGKPLLPPRWAFGPWMGREAGAWARYGLVKGDAVGEMLAVVNRFKELDIPHTALYAEGPSAGNPKLYEGLCGSGVRVLGWHSPTPDHWANVKPLGNKVERFKPALLHMQDGSVFVVPKARFCQGNPYFDFTHPQAIECIREEFRDWLRLGLAGTMVDDGDDVPLNAFFHNGHTGRRMHNRFHYDYHKTFNQVFREVRGDDFILFARAAGPGCQQFTAFFAGDHPESFDGLEAVIHGGLSFSASGFPFWGSDIGGLLPRPGEDLTEPVYLRWVAFAAFSPLMRAHGCSPREPWRFSERAVQVYAYYARLRMNLLPTIYSLAVQAHRTGIPLMRIGYLEFPDDPEALKTQRAYSFGDDLWFVPPTHAERTVDVYLPGKGSWTDLRTGETFPAGQRVNRPCDYGVEPLFLRRGAILLAELDEPTLSWGKSLTSGKRLCVVANANGNGSGHRLLHHARDEAQQLDSSTADGSWRLTSGRWSTQVGAFVVYGPPPQEVDWANRALPCLGDAPNPATGPSTAGWWYDPSQRCTKVRIEPPASEAAPDVCLCLRYGKDDRKR